MIAASWLADNWENGGLKQSDIEQSRDNISPEPMVVLPCGTRSTPELPVLSQVLQQ